ncbi:MAG: DUF3089 domain-containing protein [Bacteroidota bacterium]
MPKRFSVVILVCMKQAIFLFLMIPLLLSAQKEKAFKSDYDIEDIQKVPKAPDYSQLRYWIAHPEVKDMADVVPGKGELIHYQESAEVDVFFVYPTIYSGKQNPENPWFADVDDEKLNEKIANSTIKNQATVFNSAGKVYSPLYRQAHLGVYYSDLKLKTETLEYAYLDVKRAFEYYLKNWNNDRPLILASHSQGTTHAVKLLKEFFEGKPLMDKLVAAYVVGMPLRRDTFSGIPICEEEEDTGCWLSWNTYKNGYYPPNHDFWYDNGLSINPLSWKSDEAYVSWGMNQGGVLRNFKKIRQGLSDAQNKDGMLWINKPKFFGNFLFNWDRYHIVDYNLFYVNIRENAEVRVEKYLMDHQ